MLHSSDYQNQHHNVSGIESWKVIPFQSGKPEHEDEGDSASPAPLKSKDKGSKSFLFMLSVDVILSQFLLTFALSGSTSSCLRQWLKVYVCEKYPVSYISAVIMTSQSMGMPFFKLLRTALPLCRHPWCHFHQRMFQAIPHQYLSSGLHQHFPIKEGATVPYSPPSDTSGVKHLYLNSLLLVAA